MAKLKQRVIPILGYLSSIVNSVANSDQFHILPLLSKKPLTQNVFEIRFKKPDDYVFQPGQFASFLIPTIKGELLRSYSITSLPTAPYLEFCIKHVPEGEGSTALFHLKEGEEVRVSSPKGHFVYKNPKLTKNFVATGVGIAPIMSILESLPKNEKADLLFGVGKKKDIFWHNRFEELKRSHPNLTIRITLSRPEAGWSGLVGRVTDHVMINQESEYYLCGSPAMVKDVRSILIKGEVNTKNVHFEIF